MPFCSVFFRARECGECGGEDGHLHASARVVWGVEGLLNKGVAGGSTTQFLCMAGCARHTHATSARCTRTHARCTRTHARCTRALCSSYAPRRSKNLALDPHADSPCARQLPRGCLRLRLTKISAHTNQLRRRWPPRRRAKAAAVRNHGALRRGGYRHLRRRLRYSLPVDKSRTWMVVGRKTKTDEGIVHQLDARAGAGGETRSACCAGGVCCVLVADS